MGYRTVVIVDNDRIDQAKDNPEFGTNFYNMVLAGARKWSTARPSVTDGVCTVVEQNHADVVNLLLVNSLHAESLAQTAHWYNPTKQLDMLRAAALKLGYRLTKIPESQLPD